MYDFHFFFQIMYFADNMIRNLKLNFLCCRCEAECMCGWHIELTELVHIQYPDMNNATCYQLESENKIVLKFEYQKSENLCLYSMLICNRDSSAVK
jgi:hypothetical protein